MKTKLGIWNVKLETKKMKAELTQRLKTFLDKGDWSIRTARDLEAYLDLCLATDPTLPVEDLRDDLASFSPGGG